MSAIFLNFFGGCVENQELYVGYLNCKNFFVGHLTCVEYHEFFVGYLAFVEDQ